MPPKKHQIAHIGSVETASVRCAGEEPHTEVLIIAHDSVTSHPVYICLSAEAARRLASQILTRANEISGA